ncbi:hypothetical protein JQK15_19090 [Sphingobium sp. BHU LFT2]|uniref:OprO/OprP family phosphate-selective porin n=1 Tax=Sphingobium sp. BHU LFT2 TaxID=2807634 RepID=UPI001BEB4B92|nr:porin [Sphingobium sp. BHU LFT2]MBT2245628.1 hypothetical protein [Sphingobium sp. BHU LFT2]
MKSPLAVAVLATAVCGPSGTALAQTSLEQVAERLAEQEARLKAQAKEIESLKAELAKVQKVGEVPTPGSSPAASSPAASAAAVPSQTAPDMVPLRIVGAGRAPSSDAATATRNLLVQAGRIETLDGANWDRGSPEFVSKDGNFSFRPRIRMFTDFGATFGSKAKTRNLSGTEQRLFDLGFEGRAGAEFSYLYEAGFGDNRLTVKNAFVAWSRALDSKHILEIAVGNRVTGRTMDGSTSINDIHFMERNVVASSTQPQKGYYGLGVRGRIYGPRWHVAAEVAGNDVNSAGSANDGVTYSIRSHWNPLRTTNSLLHIAAWGYREQISSSLNGVQRNIYIGGHVPDALQVQSGIIVNPRSGYGAGFELGGVFKSFWFSAEGGGRHLSAQTDAEFRAASISAGYFLTGETVAYADKIGIWGRQQVLTPVGRGGWGALELLARYETVTLENGSLGGEGKAATIGANWFLTPNVRLMANYIHWSLDNQSGTVTGADAGDTVAMSMRLTY